MENRKFQIITFYEFKVLPVAMLPGLKIRLKGLMQSHGIKGTIILAGEGFNSTVCGTLESIEKFTADASLLLGTAIRFRSSFHDECPFRRVEVKVKPEIVTLKRSVNISAGEGTHVTAGKWNTIISDPGVFLLDSRNDYEYRNGTFRGAINPRTVKFSELPDFVAANLDPKIHKKVAVFCTGGVRCEKFVPFMKQLGFEEVYQLEGGILKYLEDTKPEESLWTGECFVFDDRVTVDHELKKGNEPDRSLEWTS